MNRVKKGRIADRISQRQERSDLSAGGTVLAHRLLISKAQRAVGKVGVHPSAPIEVNTRRKRLKLKALGLFQNGAFLPSFGHRQRIGGKGKDWGKQAPWQMTLREAFKLHLEHLSKCTRKKN